MTLRPANLHAVIRVLDDVGEVRLELSDIARRYFNLATAGPGGFVIDLRSAENGGPQPGECCWEGRADASDRFTFALAVSEFHREVQGCRLDAWTTKHDGGADDATGSAAGGAVGFQDDPGGSGVGHAGGSYLVDALVEGPR